MMDGAYFISKNELLSWINDLLKINLTKVEQLGTGAVHAQILDIIYPGEVALHKVNWKARLEWEFVNNWKVLQQAFQKANISKYIDVAKLVKAKYQDNLEFGQWMKRFYALKLGQEIRKDYDPVARRNHVTPDFSFVEKQIPSKASLDYHNYPQTSENGKRTRKDLEHSVDKVKKQIRMNNGEAHTLHNKENKAPVNSMEFEKIKKERDELQQKLNYIEHMVMNNQDKSDSALVQELRSCFVIQGYDHGFERIEDHMGNGEENLLHSGKEDNKEVLMLIEGESI